MKKIYMLNGIDCANCASKIEREVSKLDGIKNANVNFMSKKLIFETEGAYNTDDIKRVISKVEPYVQIEEFIEDKKNAYENDKQKKQLIKIIISSLLFICGLIIPFPGWYRAVFFILIYAIISREIAVKALLNLFKAKIFDENFLMTIATIGAFVIGEYPEGVAVMLFYQIGEFFQDFAVKRSRREVASLMNIRPDYANIQVNGNIKRVSPDKVNVGDMIIVKSGEKIPLDGIVVEGASSVDTSALTGESLPKDVQQGDGVFSGCINKNGLLTIKVTKKYSDSTVSKILEMVESASEKKAKSEKFITKFARYYTPVVVFVATIIAVIPPVITNTNYSIWLYRALIFLVISCPCALVISIPLGFFGGIGKASKSGILVKGGNYLEALSEIEAVVFDKTGTLTKGVFNVQEIKTKFLPEDEFLRLIAHCESISNHPISKSILSAYGSDIDESLISSGEEIPGYGIKSVIEGRSVLAGNSKLMQKESIIYDSAHEIGTIVHVAIDGVYAGYITISDEIKSDSKDAIIGLKSKGIKRLVMLTGDSKKVARSIADKIGIGEFYAELLPNDKVKKLEDIIEKSSGKTMFVGDGINDAPVLARADIGVAMGGLGSDAAIEVADIVIMTDEPSKISTAIEISKQTLSRVKQNIYFSLGVKLLFLILGTFGLTTMWEAVFADVGVSLIAILNAIRK